MLFSLQFPYVCGFGKYLLSMPGLGRAKHNIQIRCICSLTEELVIIFFIFFQILYVKLFFILGILWICECLKLLLPVNSHIAQEDQGGSEEYIFQAIDVLLFLRGFFFFVIFIMKKSVLINLQAYFISIRLIYIIYLSFLILAIISKDFSILIY